MDKISADKFDFELQSMPAPLRDELLQCAEISPDYYPVDYRAHFHGPHGSLATAMWAFAAPIFVLDPSAVLDALQSVRSEREMGHALEVMNLLEIRLCNFLDAAHDPIALAEVAVDIAPEWSSPHRFLSDAYRQAGRQGEARIQVNLAILTLIDDRDELSPAELAFETLFTGRTNTRRNLIELRDETS